MINANPNNENDVLNAKEVSEYLRIPLSTVYALAKKGQLKGVKIGKHWRYLKSDICNSLNGPNGSHPLSGRERRTKSRINCEIPAAILVALIRHNGHEAKGVIQNLCEGGVFFLNGGINNGLRVGDPVFVVFDIPVNGGSNDACRKIRTEGRVIRVQNNGTNALAIKFRSMNSEDREAIHAYVG